MEMEMIYRLSMMVGFLTAGFLALLVAAAAVALYVWYKSSMKDLDRLMDELEKKEE